MKNLDFPQSAGANSVERPFLENSHSGANGTMIAEPKISSLVDAKSCKIASVNVLFCSFQTQKFFKFTKVSKASVTLQSEDIDGTRDDNNSRAVGRSLQEETYIGKACYRLVSPFNPEQHDKMIRIDMMFDEEKEASEPEHDLPEPEPDPPELVTLRPEKILQTTSYDSK
jgi:hypothetical protein